MNAWVNAFLFFLPAGIANAAPVLSTYIPGLKGWNTPLDFGKSWRGSRIFGDNKSWRGLLVGAAAGGLTAFLESTLAYSALSQDKLWFTLAGVLMGAGALIGDAIESFFKRRMGIKPGQVWFPFDQIDYIIGGLIAVSPFVQWYPALIGRILVLYFGLHLLTNFVAYKLGIRDQPI
jgi:CDP-2,3-bis-(O-geranylgeranyl)-sn-glycerol synthase